ncbi:MAG: MBL fold metallo-hydrolase [Nodosilinea sp.]
MADSISSSPAKSPRQVFETVLAFPPNRDTLGGTAYLIINHGAEGSSHILVDAPPWDDATQEFLLAQGGVRWLFITHRASLGQAAKVQKALGCELVIQEQEAYLLPNVPQTTFQHTFRFSPQTTAFWTPGYSPGSACLYHSAYGGVLFTGRHLLPDRDGNPVPLRFAKTFHWPRQLAQVEALKTRFTADTLAYLCPAANTGFLRGQRAIDNAYDRLQRLDLAAYKAAEALL